MKYIYFFKHLVGNLCKVLLLQLFSNISQVSKKYIGYFLIFSWVVQTYFEE